MKNYLYLLISTLFIVCSCSVEDTLCQESKSDIQKYFISKEAALDIADKVLGWGGSCNGYYSGSVFSASSYNFTPQNYFAVRRDWQ